MKTLAEIDKEQSRVELIDEIIRRLDVLWPWYESTKMPDGWAKRMPGEWADMRAENKELRDTIATLAADNAALRARLDAIGLDNPLASVDHGPSSDALILCTERLEKEKADSTALRVENEALQDKIDVARFYEPS